GNIISQELLHQGTITATGDGILIHGNVRGPGSFPGRSKIEITGKYQPGGSPAIIDFGGDLSLSSDAHLVLEIDGPTPGTGHDQLNIAGQFTVGGIAEIVLADNYMPTAGQSFNLLNFGSLDGTFSEILFTGSELPADLQWDTTALLTDGILQVRTSLPAVPGDYDASGTVDINDYALWKATFGSTTQLAADGNDNGVIDAGDYTIYRDHLNDHSSTLTGMIIAQSSNIGDTVSISGGDQTWQPGWFMGDSYNQNNDGTGYTNWTTLAEGIDQFSNRNYVLTNIPAQMVGIDFYRRPIGSGSLTANPLTVKAPLGSIVYVISSNAYSHTVLEASLTSLGFTSRTAGLTTPDGTPITGMELLHTGSFSGATGFAGWQKTIDSTNQNTGVQISTSTHRELNVVVAQSSNVNFQPTTKAELQTAVDLWISDNATALSTYGEINTWDVSLITDMSELFKDKTTFNDDIGNWDVSNVTTMSQTFKNATSFNGDISTWDVSSVTSMYEMFFDAYSFSGDVSNWVVSSVTNMRATFEDAQVFNADISGWDVSNVTNMLGTFIRTYDFNQDISGWDVSNVTTMQYLFYDATSFNQDISGWDISNVTNMTHMFVNPDALSNANKGMIHSSFSSNSNWPYDWSSFAGDNPPTDIALTNAVTSLPENADTTSAT
ncbi:MAG: BspA family leucine-rich repeat surface protein, partial [Pirellulaceae bacterium]|nr:BspA family leucine-rich repeat surface protein [Pirellulaceae bacterium]